jgi:hypothetical protein
VWSTFKKNEKQNPTERGREPVRDVTFERLNDSSFTDLEISRSLIIAVND